MVGNITVLMIFAMLDLSHYGQTFVFSASLSINIASISAVFTDLSVCASVCLPGGCTVAKRQLDLDVV